ncbi:MAG: cytochrome P450 [Gammaproteobacteria bacterium]|nr:cytochrome P450 [Gammaproteobacteria bacterium]
MDPNTDNVAHLRNRARDADQRRSGRRLRVAPDRRDVYDIPLSEINVANPELFKTQRAFRYFQRLRNEAPVHYCRDSQYGPYWSITRYHDIAEVDKNHRVFSSSFEHGGVTITGTPNSSNEIPNFISMDPPDHAEQRKAVAPGMAPRRLHELESLIRERAAEILDNLPKNEAFDWVPAVSVELTGRMLATVLGVPQTDRYDLIKWSNAISNADDPNYATSGADFYQTLAEMNAYFQDIWQEKKVNPGEDLISMLANSPATRDMDAKQLVGNMVLLMVGGNDTTRNSISGGVLALNQFPEQYKKLRADNSLVQSMVPEIIRWQTPLISMRRTAVNDFEFKGQQISKGDMVVMWYLSGNRDERAIAQPNEFIIDRMRPREHLSFGFGVHRCLGNRLAEMQLRVVWEEILKRFDRLEVLDEPVRASSTVFNAIQSMHVSLGEKH